MGCACPRPVHCAPVAAVATAAAAAAAARVAAQEARLRGQVGTLLQLGPLEAEQVFDLLWGPRNLPLQALEGAPCTCGSTFKAGLPFCGNCGQHFAALPERAAPLRGRAPHCTCGGLLRPGAHFCGCCGRRSPAAAPSPPPRPGAVAAEAAGPGGPGGPGVPRRTPAPPACSLGAALAAGRLREPRPAEPAPRAAAAAPVPSREELLLAAEEAAAVRAAQARWPPSVAGAPLTPRPSPSEGAFAAAEDGPWPSQALRGHPEEAAAAALPGVAAAASSAPQAVAPGPEASTCGATPPVAGSGEDSEAAADGVPVGREDDFDVELAICIARSLEDQPPPSPPPPS